MIEGFGSDSDAGAVDVPDALSGLGVGPEHHPDVVGLSLAEFVEFLNKLRVLLRLDCK